MQIRLIFILLPMAYSYSVVMNFLDVSRRTTICRVRFKLAVPVIARSRQRYALEGMTTDGVGIPGQMAGWYVYIIRTD
jgi:hypothetical protein